MDQELDKQIMPMRLIVGAMMAGVVLFGVVVLIVGPRMQPDPQLARLLLAMLGVVGLSEIAAYSVLRAVMLGKIRAQVGQTNSIEEAEGVVLPTWNTLTLIRCAMAEGFSLFGLVVALMTDSKLALAAPALGLIVLALGFPAREKLTALTAHVSGRNPYAG